MSLVHYWVINPSRSQVTVTSDGTEKIRVPRDHILLTQVLPDDEVFDPPPWVRMGIETKGWRLIHRTLPPSGLNDMGHVDWKTVADTLAGALLAFQEQEDSDDPEPEEKASRAMDDYRIAQTEAALAEDPEIEVIVESDDE